MRLEKMKHWDCSVSQCFAHKHAVMRHLTWMLVIIRSIGSIYLYSVNLSFTQQLQITNPISCLDALSGGTTVRY